MIQWHHNADCSLCERGAVIRATNKNRQRSRAVNQIKSFFIFFPFYFISCCKLLKAILVFKYLILLLKKKNAPSLTCFLESTTHCGRFSHHTAPTYDSIVVTASLYTKWWFSVNGILAGSNVLAVLYCIMAINSILQLSNPRSKTSTAMSTCCYLKYNFKCLGSHWVCREQLIKQLFPPLSLSLV